MRPNGQGLLSNRKVHTNKNIRAFFGALVQRHNMEVDRETDDQTQRRRREIDLFRQTLEVRRRRG